MSQNMTNPSISHSMHRMMKAN